MNDFHAVTFLEVCALPLLPLDQLAVDLDDETLEGILLHLE